MRPRQNGATRAPAAPPASSVRLRAAEVIAEQLEKVFAQVATAVDGRDPEGVHDMRVATRRLRAALKVFAPWLDADAYTHLAPVVRRLTRALGRVRELDVLRLRLGGLSVQAAPKRALAIEFVDARLAGRRRRARTRMMARFAKVDLDRLQNRLHRLAAQLVRHASAPPANETAALAAPARDAHDATAPQDQPIAALLEALGTTLVGEAHDISCAAIPVEVGSPHAAEALHKVRIAAKKLRYQLEIVVPYLGTAGEESVRRLRALQDKLGDFHDDTVLDDTLRAAIERAVERGRPLLASELRALRKARRRALLRDERAVRAAIVELRDADFVAQVIAALGSAGVVVQAAAEIAPLAVATVETAVTPPADAEKTLSAAAAAGLPTSD